jgi:hypothetical protein
VLERVRRQRRLLFGQGEREFECLGGAGLENRQLVTEEEIPGRARAEEDVAAGPLEVALRATIAL